VTTVAYIGLGSNVGDRRATIEASVRQLDGLEGLTVTCVSTLIETAPVGPVDQGPFLNGVAQVTTEGSVFALLGHCLSVERRLGRDRSTTQRWGPRTIDLDILLFGDGVITTPDLTVPHPRLHLRQFVLEPLAEIAPDLLHPVLGTSVKAMLHEAS
jgi:2-amino-4-hydroxy-6-hydroxymethyldihydropteridine diphosphokinase